MPTIFRPPVAAVIGATVLATVMVPSEAKAFQVNLPDSTKWKISTVSFTEPPFTEENFNTFGALASQVWWQSKSLARTFSTAVYEQGGNTALGFSGRNGPYFAWENAINPFALTSEFTRTSNGEAVSNVDTNLSDTFTGYAVATEIPGPLPVLGAFAAFGWSRRMRQRIQAAKLTPVNSQV